MKKIMNYLGILSFMYFCGYSSILPPPKFLRDFAYVHHINSVVLYRPNNTKVSIQWLKQFHNEIHW